MDLLSPEEENYVRMSLLLTGISPRAVRTCFDGEFPPASLEGSLKKEYNKLVDLKDKCLINQLQWNRLFPRSPGVPDSKTFGIILMITLLRNLTNLIPSHGEVDCLPTAMDTTLGGDLARMEYYLKYLAHLDDGRVESTDFTTAWGDISEAIGRVGGHHMKKDCDQLRTETLDQTNPEIMTNIKLSRNEIKEVKQMFESLKRSHQELYGDYAKNSKEVKRLKMSVDQKDDTLPHVRLNRSHEAMQADHSEIKPSQEFQTKGTQEMEGVEYSANDSVTFNVGVYIQTMIEDWSNGKVHAVFSNINMKKPQFRQIFLSHLNKLAIPYQRQLVHIIDKYKSRELYIAGDGDGNYDTALLYCCYIGDVSLVQWCCNHGVNIDRCAYNNKSPIMIACEHGNTEVVKMLLDRRANYNKRDRRGELPLIKACEHGHIEIAKLLLDRGADYNKCNNYGQSSLMKACEHGHIEIVKILLDRGADYNNCNNYGQSSIMKACEHGHIDIVKILLDRGADYNKCNNYDRSPVMKACIHGYTKIVKMLLDRGADCNKCDSWRLSPVMMACKHGHTEIIKMLLDRGADFNKCDDDSKSPLMKACEHGDTEIVKMLLDRGADYNRCDRDGKSPVMMACTHGHTEIVKMLFDKRSDCNICYLFLLRLACVPGHTEIVKMLLDRGADYNKCDNDGQSPVMMARTHGHTEIIKMLLESGEYYEYITFDSQSHVWMTRQDGHGKIKKTLLDILRASPLMMTCEHGHIEIVKMLLDRGADCNACDFGQSPLEKACEHGHTEIVKMLLDRGADCNKYGQSPLMKACVRGHTEIVKMLLDRGADYIKSRSSVPMDVLCDGIHLVCFTDTRLDMKCVYYTDSFIKVKTTLHGQESSLLKCDGHLIHCIQDERLSRTFKSINDKAVTSNVCEDPTIPDIVKLTYIYGLIKRKEFSRESWEDMLKFTIVNKKPVFCYFLLANAENIMTTDQPKFHDILQQALCNAMTNQDKETARGISWFIVRKFYRSLSSSLKETIIDTWPSFECKCDNRNMRKTVPNFCSSSMIIIIETEKAGNDFPKTFWEVNVKYIVNDKIDKNECKEIHKKLQTSLSEVHFLNKVVISGVDAKTVFTEHSNLTLMCKSAFKSKGFLKDEHEFVDVPCVQLYCKSKGVIPVGESHFPKTICGLQTDILEGSPCFLAGIRVGDEIGTDEFKRGTLGGFLLIRGVKTFLTCLHVFLNADELSADNISLNDEKLSMVKLYPRSSAVQNSHECGYIRDIAFQVDNEKETSIDAALIEFTAGTSIDSQDYMALDNGKLSYVDVGMNSDYLNNSCVDYRPLCFSTPRPILQTVSVGAVSGFSDCKISEVLENKEKFVDLEYIEDLYSKVVLDEVRARAKLIIAYFQSITLARIPDEQTIVQYIEQICDPDISAEIKAILCSIVKNVYLKLQSNTDESVENIIQEVSLHHTHSSFSAIIGNVHMQKVFIMKTGENMATKRIKRRVYNQLHISNIPFKPGDSGTCIYVLRPVRGCIGMAIANHPLGGCIATPIMEILKHFKIGIK